MLIEFKVANCLSFKEEETLSMVASNDKSLPANVYESAQGSKYNLLKSAVLYGANASGKSNLMKALQFMIYFVLNSAAGEKISSEDFPSPFKLDENCLDKPSTFSIAFLMEGVEYEYGFELYKNKVVKEWLYNYPKKQPRLLFLRENGEKQSFKFGPHWSGPGKSLVDKTRDEVLFLTVADTFNNQIAKKVYEFFKEYIKTVSELPASSSEIGFTNQLILDNTGKKQNILKQLKKADIGISDLDISKVPLKESRAYANFPPKAIESLEKVLPDLYEITTYRQGLDKKGKDTYVPFDFETEESDGTRKYYSLAGPIDYVLSRCCLLFSDEFDLRLHPVLSRNLVEMFHSTSINPKGSQLIFTTHTVSLLDLSLFRRDQIWFTAKEEGGETSLFSLWDFKGEDKARKHSNIYKDYLAGRYGAIPFVEGLLEERD